MEVYSDWGDGVRPVGVRSPEGRFGGLSGGTPFLAALAQGHELGVTGDADHHAGLPGRRQAFGVAPSHDHPPGLTAARMGRLDAESVLDAYRRRATYATTGERIWLDVRAGPRRRATRERPRSRWARCWAPTGPSSCACRSRGPRPSRG
jgi:hypothetical protein